MRPPMGLSRYLVMSGRMRLEMKVRDQRSSSALTLRLFELMRHVSQMGGGGGFGAPKAGRERRTCRKSWFIRRKRD